MDNMFDDPPVPHPTELPVPEASPVPPTQTPVSLAVERFRSCRWRAQELEAGVEAFCTHRDVLPFAGKTGFDPGAWCPDCAFYKLRRTPKKRENQYTY